MTSSPYSAKRAETLLFLALSGKLSKALKNALPSEQANAWARYRQDRFVDLGLEGLTGPRAVYHLSSDAAPCLAAAARLLDGGGEPSTPARKIPGRVIEILVKAYGYRYLRGVGGIRDALLVKGVGIVELSKFNNGREDFRNRFLVAIDAARKANPKGADWRAVVDVTRMFVKEMYQCCFWLRRADVSWEAAAIERQLSEALNSLTNNIFRSNHE